MPLGFVQPDVLVALTPTGRTNVFILAFVMVEKSKDAPNPVILLKSTVAVAAKYEVVFTQEGKEPLPTSVKLTKSTLGIKFPFEAAFADPVALIDNVVKLVVLVLKKNEPIVARLVD